MALPFPTAAEDLFTETPPDYDSERTFFLIKLFVVFCLWVLIIPSFLAKEVPNDAAVTDDVCDNGNERRKEGNGKDVASKNTISTINNKSNEKYKKKGRRESRKPDKDQKHQEQRQPVAATHKVIDTCTNIYCIVGLILHLLYLLLKSSPDNYYTTRSVFETPLFTDEECRYVVDMAERAAQVNYETALLKVSKNGNNVDDDAAAAEVSSTSINMENAEDLLKEPYGWQKKRHQSHPTTDLNLVVDPFSDDDREWIRKKLDARLAPALERIFGVPPASIRANDVSLSIIDCYELLTMNSITMDCRNRNGFEGQTLLMTGGNTFPSK